MTFSETRYNNKNEKKPHCSALDFSSEYTKPSHANNKINGLHRISSVLSNDSEKDVHCVFVYISSKFLRKSGIIACQYVLNPSQVLYVVGKL